MQYKGLFVCFSLEKINTLYLTVLAFSWQAQLLSENAGSGMQGNTERTHVKRKKESEVFLNYLQHLALGSGKHPSLTPCII